MLRRRKNPSEQIGGVIFNKEGSRGIFVDDQDLHLTTKSTCSLAPIRRQDEGPRWITQDDQIKRFTGYKETNSEEGRVR
jgi:hypothetical protein